MSEEKKVRTFIEREHLSIQNMAWFILNRLDKQSVSNEFISNSIADKVTNELLIFNDYLKMCEAVVTLNDIAMNALKSYRMSRGFTPTEANEIALDELKTHAEQIKRAKEVGNE